MQVGRLRLQLEHAVHVKKTCNVIYGELLTVIF